MNKEDLALNNREGLICHKAAPTSQHMDVGASVCICIVSHARTYNLFSVQRKEIF